jgi:hypothetical protein
MNIGDILKLLLNGFELAAAVAGFYYMNKWRKTCWQWFAYFLLFTLLTELLAKYMYFQPALKPNNYMVYRYANIPVTVLFFLWVLQQAFISTLLRKLVGLAAMIYIAVWLMEQWWFTTFVKSSSLSMGIGFLEILFFAIVWLIKLVRSQQVLHFKKNMYFWFTAGLLIFYIVTLPFQVFRVELYRNNPDILMAYWYFTFIFNYIMYSFFILGFKWAEPKSSYSL